MACGRAARILPLRRGPRTRSPAATLATPAVTTASAPGSAASARAWGAATYETVLVKARPLDEGAGVPGRQGRNYGPEVKEINVWQVMAMGFICGARIPIATGDREAGGAAWGAGDRQPRRLINDNWRRDRIG